MRTIVVCVVLFIIGAARAQETCSKYCNPEVSKPCGNACISKHNACRKTWTTACVGIREEKKKIDFTPKHVNQPPK